MQYLPAHIHQSHSQCWIQAHRETPGEHSMQLWNYCHWLLCRIAMRMISHRLGNLIHAAAFLDTAVQTLCWHGSRSGRVSPTLPWTLAGYGIVCTIIHLPWASYTFDTECLIWEIMQGRNILFSFQSMCGFYPNSCDETQKMLNVSVLDKPCFW